MLFKTREEHEALRAKVREFVETEVKPISIATEFILSFPISTLLITISLNSLK